MPINVAKKVNRIGMVARWRPVHVGHARILTALCRHTQEALIGIGSANRYNVRNPFTLDETTAMLSLTLTEHPNHRLIPVPDLDDGPRWRLMILDLFGDLDIFVTANPYVAHLLSDDYQVIHPASLLSDDEKIPLDGTMVRRAMARGEDWQSMVPPVIANYLVSTGLDARFRREFGLQTLAMETNR